jgi:hypothetical protein
MKLNVTPKLVEKLAWVPIISFCKISFPVKHLIPYYAKTGRSCPLIAWLPNNFKNKKREGKGMHPKRWGRTNEKLEKLLVEGHVCKVMVFMYLFIYKIQICGFEGVAIFFHFFSNFFF